MIIGLSGKIGAGKDLTAKIIQYIMSEYYFDKQIINKFDEHLIRYIPHNFQIKKFAGKLKQIVSLLTGISLEDLEKQEVKDNYLGEEWNYCLGFDGINKQIKLPISNFINDEIFKKNPERFIQGYKVRDLLQLIGTECGRDIIHQNIWVNSLFADYKLIQGNFSDKEIEELKRNDKVNPIGGISMKGIYPNWVISDLRFENEFQAIKDRSGICIRIERPQIEEIGKTSNTISHSSETALDNHKFDYLITNDGTIEDLIEQVKDILIKEKII